MAINNSFENLEQIPKQVVKQVAKLPGDIASNGVKTVVGGRAVVQPDGKQVDPLTGIEIPSKQRVKQLQKQEKKMKKAAIPHTQQIIQGMQKPQSQNIPAYISGKPGFSQDQAIKQMQGIDTSEKKELPLPVSSAKHRGGTNERRKGVGG